jgi:hypothetical protein
MRSFFFTLCAMLFALCAFADEKKIDVTFGRVVDSSEDFTAEALRTQRGHSFLSAGLSRGSFAAGRRRQPKRIDLIMPAFR